MKNLVISFFLGLLSLMMILICSILAMAAVLVFLGLIICIQQGLFELAFINGVVSFICIISFFILMFRLTDVGIEGLKKAQKIHYSK